MKEKKEEKKGEMVLRKRKEKEGLGFV